MSKERWLHITTLGTLTWRLGHELTIIHHTWPGTVSGGSDQSGIQIMGPCTITGNLYQSGIL